jgi:hypothetical protein
MASLSEESRLARYEALPRHRDDIERNLTEEQKEEAALALDIAATMKQLGKLSQRGKCFFILAIVFIIVAGVCVTTWIIVRYQAFGRMNQTLCLNLPDGGTTCVGAPPARGS